MKKLNLDLDGELFHFLWTEHSFLSGMVVSDHRDKDKKIKYGTAKFDLVNICLDSEDVWVVKSIPKDNFIRKFTYLKEREKCHNRNMPCCAGDHTLKIDPYQFNTPKIFE